MLSFHIGKIPKDPASFSTIGCICQDIVKGEPPSLITYSYVDKFAGRKSDRHFSITSLLLFSLLGFDFAIPFRPFYTDK
jgi:hypothetical protein